MIPEAFKNILAKLLVKYKDPNFVELQESVLAPDFYGDEANRYLPVMPPTRNVPLIVVQEKKDEKEKKKKTDEPEYRVRDITGFRLTKRGFMYKVAWEGYGYDE